MDIRFHWLRCRDPQGKLLFYCSPGATHWDDYSTKHHPPLYQYIKNRIVQHMQGKHILAFDFFSSLQNQVI